MQLQKATDILRAYRENNYNASQALPKVGYAKDTATKSSKIVLNRAMKTVAKEQLKAIVNDSNPIHNLLALVGITKEELLGEYISVIAQNKDLSTKLKAMLPLLAEHGIKWNEDKVDVQVPILNVTVKDNKKDIIVNSQGGGVVGNESDKS